MCVCSVADILRAAYRPGLMQVFWQVKADLCYQIRFGIRASLFASSQLFVDNLLVVGSVFALLPVVEVPSFDATE